MGPNMSNWTIPTVPSLSVGNTKGNLASECSPATTKCYPGGDCTPAAERTPATEHTPATERTPAAECTPATERTPAAEHTPAAERTSTAEEHTPASNCLPATKHQAGRMIAQRASTRKPNCSRAEIEAANATAAIKRAEKARQMAHNAEAKRQKTSQKEARAALKTADPPSEPRFIWTDDGSLEALRFIKALKEEFDWLSKARPIARLATLSAQGCVLCPNFCCGIATLQKKVNFSIKLRDDKAKKLVQSLYPREKTPIFFEKCKEETILVRPGKKMQSKPPAHVIILSRGQVIFDWKGQKPSPSLLQSLGSNHGDTFLAPTSGGHILFLRKKPYVFLNSNN
jgi:hypothetical protein